jgi:hypothetical protein
MENFFRIVLSKLALELKLAHRLVFRRIGFELGTIQTDMA